MWTDGETEAQKVELKSRQQVNHIRFLHNFLFLLSGPCWAFPGWLLGTEQPGAEGVELMGPLSVSVPALLPLPESPYGTK